MGLGEMLGVKSIKIETKEKMDLAGLYEKIKDVKFEAGVPEYVKHGFGYVIAFPQIDRENQVWIVESRGKFIVQRSVVIAGVGNMIKNEFEADVLDKLSGGVTGMISTFGSPKKTCMAHCDSVADTIKAMNL